MASCSLLSSRQGRYDLGPTVLRQFSVRAFRRLGCCRDGDRSDSDGAAGRVEAGGKDSWCAVMGDPIHVNAP